MSFNMWTYALFVIEAIAYTTLDLAQYTPVGSSCLVADARFGPYSLRGECQLFTACIEEGSLSLKCPDCSDDNFNQCCHAIPVPCFDANNRYSGHYCRNVKGGCPEGKFISVPNICPGDPSDIQCCVRSPSNLHQSGARPASSSLDSNNVHIPGVGHPNLPDIIMVPDSSIFDPLDQSKVNEYFLQRTQSETPPTDSGESDPMSDGDSFYLYAPEEELWVSFGDDPNLESDPAAHPVSAGPENIPASDLDSAMFPFSETSSEDDQLVTDLLGDNDDPESPSFLGQG